MNMIDYVSVRFNIVIIYYWKMYKCKPAIYLNTFLLLK